LPRRYHRPPTVKRRKARRPGSAGPNEDTIGPEAAVGAATPLDDFSDEEWDEGEEVEDRVQPVAVVETPAQSATRAAARHIQRDYSYVRSELTRIAVLAVVLLAALMVVAILR